MVKTVETVEVVVTRLKTRLLKVTHPKGYQLVVGGRLLLEDVGGRKTCHPDLPEYRPEMFPVPYSEWDDEQNTVTVAIVGTGEKVIGSVRAQTMLYTPMPVEAVKAWLNSQRGAKK